MSNHRRTALLLLAISAAAPSFASSSASSTQPPADLRQCLTKALGASNMLVMVSPLADEGFAIEAKPFGGGKPSSIIVNALDGGATLRAETPKSAPSPSPVDLALKGCAAY